MSKAEIDSLLLKYNEGVADPSEIQMIEKLIEQGLIDLKDLRSLQLLDDQIMKSVTPSPSLSLDSNFYAMLADEKAKRHAFSFKLPSFSILMPRLALAAAVLICGFVAGYFFHKPDNSNTEVQALSKEVGDLKEMMMLSLLEKESASERLRAVSLTSDMDQASHKVTSALLQTLNNDENVNVRLAALDALRSYVRNAQVREGLVKAISTQDSPLVQVALAELMRDIQEKRSVKEFDKLFKTDRTPEEVKSRIKEKIQVLI